MPTTPLKFRPPILSAATVVDGEFCSSVPYSVWTKIFCPLKCCGQWHCSQVSRAGRSAETGEGIGRGYVLKRTLNSWLVPEILALTKNDAPEPMWHSTHATRACGE